MTPVSHGDWQAVYERIEGEGVQIQSGGSCANTIVALGLLGAKPRTTPGAKDIGSHLPEANDEFICITDGFSCPLYSGVRRLAVGCGPGSATDREGQRDNLIHLSQRALYGIVQVRVDL